MTVQNSKMFFWILSIVVLIILFVICVIPDLIGNPPPLNLPLSKGGNDSVATVVIGDAKIQVEIADDLAEQIQGLSGRDALCDSCGMLFVYPAPFVQFWCDLLTKVSSIIQVTKWCGVYDKPQILTFWMKDMKFALDIIFIRDGRVTEIYEHVPPPDSNFEIPKVTSQQTADMVLEVNGGFTRNNGLKNGDQLVLQ